MRGIFGWVASHVATSLLIASGAALVVMTALYQHERAAHFAASLRAENNLALADTSKRIVNAKVQKVLGDSTAAWQRRGLQITQRADSLDKALKLERQSRVDVGVRIQPGRGTGSGVVRVIRDTSRAAAASAPSDEVVRSIRQAHFDVKAGVFDVAADVSLPAPPARGTMAATVTAPKIPLGIRLYCGSVTDGIRRADAVVTGPVWATVGIDHVETTPEMCNPGKNLVSTGLKLPWWTNILSAAGGAYLGYRAGSK